MAPAKRMTITIPDDLAERLEPWRDRMNMSKVCAKALETEVIVLEYMNNEFWPRPRERTALVQAYEERVAMREGGMRYERTMGYRAGITYANEFKADDAYYRQIRERLRQDKLPEPVEKEFAELVEIGELMTPHDWFIGWLQGAAEEWGEMKKYY